jgi:ABC-type Fe3+-hydroxamate transport system substrate-binding protein
MSKNMVVYIIVAVLVVAAIGVYTLSNSSSDNNKYVDSYPTGRLWVLGNANNDDYIDQSDVDYINNIISRGSINYKDYFMCDANNDGKIDSDDVKQVQALIAGTADKIWYVNVDKKIKSFDNTKKKNVLPIYQASTEEVILLNSHLIVASDDTTTKTMYPMFRDVIPSNLPSVGDTNDPDIEAILKIYKTYGSLIIFTGTADYFNPKLESQVEPFGIQVVRLPSWEHGLVPNGILTLGYLLGETKNAYRYLDWHDRIINTITKKVSSIPDGDKVKLLVLDTFPDNADEILGPGSGDYENSELSGGNNLADIFGSTKEKSVTYEYTVEDIASLYQKNGLELIILRFNGPYLAKEGTAREYYNMSVNRFQPYMKDINISVLGGDFSVGPSYPIAMMLYASWMYPDLFKGEFNILDEYQYYLSDLIGFKSWNAKKMETSYSYLDVQRS